MASLLGVGMIWMCFEGEFDGLWGERHVLREIIAEIRGGVLAHKPFVGG
jgi:hypothetical protein